MMMLVSNNMDVVQNPPCTIFLYMFTPKLTFKFKLQCMTPVSHIFELALSPNNSERSFYHQVLPFEFIHGNITKHYIIQLLALYFFYRFFKVNI